jgi:hypothetical protein
MWREFKLAELDYGRSKGLTWHTIRHEFVSRNIENTGDPVVTQRARHKDGRTTQGYMHACESRVMAAVVRLNQQRESRDCAPRRDALGADDHVAQTCASSRCFRVGSFLMAFPVLASAKRSSYKL